jgi:amidase
LDAIAGNMPGDPYAAPPQRRPFAEEVGVDPGRLRVGMLKETAAHVAPVHADCMAAVNNVARLLLSLGHQVEDSYPAALEEVEYIDHFGNVVACHAAAWLDDIGRMANKAIAQDDVEPWTWAFAERGRRLSAAQYLKSVNWVHAWSRRVAQWWADGFDLLLTPTLAAPPPPLGELVATAGNAGEVWKKLFALLQFTPPYNVTGQPAVSLPLYWNAEGLPIGLHLVAPFGREDLLIRVASQLERERPWRDRRPRIHA